MHVLQVPSWYPSASAPMNGSFFAEQNRMLTSAGLRVGVMPVEPTRFEKSFFAVPQRREAWDGLPIARVSYPSFPPWAGWLEQKWFQRRLRRVADQYERSFGIPDIIHAHSVYPGGVAARVLAEHWDRPYVITEHRPSTITKGFSGRRATAILQAVAEAAHRLTVSRRFAERLEEYYSGYAWEPWELPVPDSFSSTPDARKPGSPFRFCHVSHLGDNKRVHTLCRTFAETFGDHNSEELVIVGGSKEAQARVRVLASLDPWPQNIRFVGPLDRDGTSRQMANADCLVLTSASEAGGTVFSEALSIGTPIIATDTWAGDFAVESGLGLKVPVDNAEALSGALRAARKGKKFLDRQAIQTRARARYSQERFVRRTADLYNQTMGKSAASTDRTHGKSKRMIFHSPMELQPHASTASGLRPLKMRQAFVDIGYEIVDVSGPVRQRIRTMRRIKKRIKQGDTFEFLYSELSSMPLALSQSLKRGFHPLADLLFFRFCELHSVPTGVFYRDVHWKFSKPTKSWASVYQRLSRIFFVLDELTIGHLVNRVFLPTDRMGTHLRFPASKVAALPPGTDLHVSGDTSTVKLVYAGGLGTFYRLQEFFKAVAAVPGVSCTVCVPQPQWDAERNKYQSLLAPNITIVHLSPEELAPFFSEATAGVLCVEPTEYWTFAAPFKLYEYLGWGLPVIATRGTHPGRVIAENGAGWVVEYDSASIEKLLRQLHSDPALLAGPTSAARQIRGQHTWAMRATEAALALTRGPALPDADQSRPASQR